MFQYSSVFFPILPSPIHRIANSRVALMAANASPDDPEAVARKRQRPNSPSLRTPHRSWRRNPADKIEHQMHETCYDFWGFAIYRTTYESDDDWSEFLRKLEAQMTRTFDRCNGRDILNAFRWTIFSDRDLYDGADTATIRAHFRHWSEQAAQQERSPQPLRDPTWEKDAPSRRTGVSARYQFCIQVDEESLSSIVHEVPNPPRADASTTGWVKLINKYWIPIQDDPQRRPGWGRGNTYEPIEGVTERDVGWVKVPYRDVMLEYYYGEEGLNQWRSDYRRPPEVAGLVLQRI